ncbi:hypothetical protein BH20CHL6_BH20CHL6_17960 [soil metagenome]
MGPELTIAASVFIFSGALQFAILGLLAAGAAAPALLATAVTLNLRHLVMGAVLRPMLGGSRLRRAGLGLVLLDETFGFAVAAGSESPGPEQRRMAVTEHTLAVSGVLCYVSWLAGTVLGVAGANLPGVEGFAGAIFPVLFIGLAALAARSRSVVVRALAAAGLTVGISVALPEGRALAPVVAGVLVALPRRGRAADDSGES